MDNCDCYYTDDEDGIHFCRMHKAAPDLLAACKLAHESIYWADAPEASEALKAAIAKATA
jgi:hypothetical protein